MIWHDINLRLSVIYYSQILHLSGRWRTIIKPRCRYYLNVLKFGPGVLGLLKLPKQILRSMSRKHI